MTGVGCSGSIRGALALVVALFAGCSFGVETAGDMPPAKGCGDAVSSGFYDGSLRHGGLERSFNVYIPKGYEGARKRPLVVAMHGGLGTGEIFEEQANLSEAADRYGFLIAYPDGIGRAFNAGSCCGTPAEKNIDDVGFVAELVDEMAATYCVDQSRVYGTGFSNGAMLTQRIACERPDLFTAIAPVAGSIMVDACSAATPTPALLIQGREDERVPWDGGTVNDSYRKPMKQVVATIAKRNHCETGEKQSLRNGAAVCMTRQGCAEGAPVTYCGIEGMGHQWPGGKTILRFMLGDNTEDYDATARIFAFFQRIGSGD